MSYPSAPGRPPWLLPAAFAVLACALVMSLGVGWLGYDRVVRKDSGLAQCERFRDRPAVAGDAGYRSLRDAFESSRHDDIRQAGIHWADVSRQASQAEDTPMAPYYRRVWRAAIADVAAACAHHGVQIVLDLPD